MKVEAEGTITIPVGTLVFSGVPPADLGEGIQNAFTNPRTLIRLASDSTPHLRTRLSDQEMAAVVSRALDQFLAGLRAARLALEPLRNAFADCGRPHLLETERIRARVLTNWLDQWATSEILYRSLEPRVASPSQLLVPEEVLRGCGELAELGTQFRMAWVETTRSAAAQQERDRLPPNQPRSGTTGDPNEWVTTKQLHLATNVPIASIYRYVKDLPAQHKSGNDQQRLLVRRGQAEALIAKKRARLGRADKSPSH